jgi:hypothetical protein
VKPSSQGGASVPASRDGDCGAPKERLKIARHFNAGSICKWHQVPEGRPTNGQRFSRPSGTYPATNLFPALKRRAIFRKSLRDYALFAIASILLAAVGAMAETTNDLSDAEIQGHNLARQLLEQSPATNFSQSGILKIRDAKGITTNIPVWFKTLITTGYWQSSYVGGRDFLIIIHQGSRANRYSFHRSLVEEQKPTEELFSFITLSESQIMTPFANSDFWICDLGLEFFHWPDQKILKHEMRRGQPCKVLESTNPNPSTNGYSRVVSWIDNESGGIIHAEAYDANGKLLKEFDPKSFKKVNGQWELQDMEIRNVQTGSRTRLEFDFKKQG